jgi:hypothetical protein
MLVGLCRIVVALLTVPMLTSAVTMAPAPFMLDMLFWLLRVCRARCLVSSRNNCTLPGGAVEGRSWHSRSGLQEANTRVLWVWAVIQEIHTYKLSDGAL